LTFLVSNRAVFDLPLSRISNSNIAGKTEVSLELTPTLTEGGKKNRAAIDEVVEMRWYVPGSANRGSDDEEGGNNDDETSAAQAFHDMIKEKAEIGKVSGDGIVTFSDILVQTPRHEHFLLL
jgi:structure-specific recognition protein 1